MDEAVSQTDLQKSSEFQGPHKFFTWKRILLFLLGIIIVSGIGIGAFFIQFEGNKVSFDTPTAQAEELFTLYFSIDYVREKSAQLFAELLAIERSPERVGGEEQLGEKPPLRSRDEIVGVLKENRALIDSAIALIEEKEFTNEEVSELHEDVRGFYAFLAEFEDRVIQKLDQAETEEDLARVIDEIFERSVFESLPDWEYLRSQDEELRASLGELAQSYGLAFEAKPYDELFQNALGALDTPTVSNTTEGLLKYPFTVEDRPLVRTNINASWSGPSISQFLFFLVHPDGRVFFVQIKEELSGDAYIEKPFSEVVQQSQFPQGQSIVDVLEKRISGNVKGTAIPFEQETNSQVAYGRELLIFALDHEDEVIQPTAGDWSLYIIAPAGAEVVLGASSY